MGRRRKCGSFSMLKNTPMGSLVLLVTFALRAGAKDKAAAASPKDENFSGFGTNHYGSTARGSCPVCGN